MQSLRLFHSILKKISLGFHLKNFKQFSRKFYAIFKRISLNLEEFDAIRRGI